MKTGAILYDGRQDRMDIRFGPADYYGGLHCGETFDVLIDGGWIPTRIEKARDWFLVGFQGCTQEQRYTQTVSAWRLRRHPRFEPR
ncbi:MAG: DUF5348 domain-containing protein [Clostridiales Family XIII bacterium]|nr:DUF5348 domain-containing protein [Clostridiales Family XIII bacterium]